MRLFVTLLFLLNASCAYQDVNRRSKAAVQPATSSAPNPAEVNSSPNSVGIPSASINNRSSGEGTIRTVDFRNFTYPWYPTGYKPPQGVREVSLHDGEFLVDENGNENDVRFDLENTSYADLTGDGSEEAIVSVGALFNPNGSYACIFVYTMRGNVLKLLWFHETGDRANGGLRNVRVIDDALVIEQYDLKFNASKGRYEDEAALCCPKRFIRSYYKWNGRTLQKTGSETLPNVNSNAEFLGYPNDSP